MFHPRTAPSVVLLVIIRQMRRSQATALPLFVTEELGVQVVARTRSRGRWLVVEHEQN